MEREPDLALCEQDWVWELALDAFVEQVSHKARAIPARNDQGVGDNAHFELGEWENDPCSGENN